MVSVNGVKIEKGSLWSGNQSIASSVPNLSKINAMNFHRFFVY